MSADVLLDTDRLIQDAAGRSGSDDFGPADFQEGLEGAMFVVNNPNATSTCGCGASFSI